MAERQVTRTGKNDDGDITSLCGGWGEASKAQAIRDIELGVHRYYVGSGTNRTDIHVVNDPDGKYLRTDPNGKAKDNLDDLPDC